MKHLLFLSFTILLASCTIVPDCETLREYHITLSSDVYDAYALYIDGEYIQDISGLSYIEVAVSEGYHHIYLEQLEGFRRQPNTEIYDVNGLSCDDVEIIFPD